MDDCVAVYLEAGSKRVFAGAIEWPGWCRPGRDESGALAALEAFASRYRTVMAAASISFPLLTAPPRFVILERLTGDSGTDFGAPTQPPAADDRPLDAAELDRQSRILQASWAAFDLVVAGAVGLEFRTGPRGGGRTLPAIVAHCLEAESAYLVKLGARAPSARDQATGAALATPRQVALAALVARARGEEPADPSRTVARWTPRYFVRRAAWHALDHAWEIEDRAAG